MPAEDLDNAALAEPPLRPLPPSAVTATSLADLADRVAAATWQLGLRRWFWGEGVCLLGMIRCGQAFHSAIPAEVLAWYDGQLLDPSRDPSLRLDHVNEVAPGTGALLAAADRGTSRTAYLPALERLREWIAGPSVTRAPSGAIEHWPGGVWADTMYMAGLFLLRLGVVRADHAIAQAGIDQVLAHARELQAPGGLFVHGSHAGVAIPCHWGRANAWAALALVEALEVAEAVGPLAGSAPALRAGLETQLLALAAHQPDHGVWDVLVDSQAENRGILETSAAAGLAAAFLRAAPLFPERAEAFERAGWRALRGTLAYLDGDGLLTRVSAGTVLQLVPFGYSVIRNDRPQLWGQGLMLSALAAAGDSLARGSGPV